MTIDNTSHVEVADNVVISDTLTLKSGSLIIESGKSLLANTKNVISGSIQAQREITGGTGWRLLSAPVTSTYGDMFDEIFTQGYGGSDSSSGSPSVLWYDETWEGTDNQRWRKPDTTTDATVPGRGLFVYVFGSIAGEDAYSQSLPVTMDVTGTESEGDGSIFDFGISYTANADTGWNLVGNPFVATIDWDAAGWTKTNMDNVIYVWDHSANSGAGAYLTWNGSTGSLGNGLIPPFQGFWVKANASAPVLKVPKTAKTTGGAFYKQASDPSPMIMLLLESDTLGATTHIQFNEGGSINKDAHDAFYLVPPTDTYLDLFSQSHDGSYLSIQSQPFRFGLPIEIPIYVDGHVAGNPLSGSYQISWPRIDAMHPEWTVTLKDLETGRELDLASENEYEFTFTGHSSKPLASMVPSRDLTRSAPFKLLKKSGSDSPRFILKVDPGDAFPEIPRDFSLGQNYPNPFNGGTIIPISIPVEAKVSVTIFDVRGRVVDELIKDKQYFAGNHHLNWLATGRSSGIYFCHVRLDNEYFTKKMILLR